MTSTRVGSSTTCGSGRMFAWTGVANQDRAANSCPSRRLRHLLEQRRLLPSGWHRLDSFDLEHLVDVTDRNTS